MFEVSQKTMFARLAMAACLTVAAFAAHAQTPPPTKAPIAPAGDIEFALTYDVGDANLTSTSPFSFLMQGGGAEVEAQIYKGLGAVGSFTGLHSSNSGQGVPVNLFVAAFGPRYSFYAGHGKHSLHLYGQSLVGEADGFSGLYPVAGAPIPSSNSLAIQTGGGIDVRLSRHLSIRVLQADWLRTYLPDSRQNVENTLRMGAGVVFHSRRE